MPRRLFTIAILAALLLLPGCIRQCGYAQIGGYAQGGTWTVKYNTAGVKPLPAEVQSGVEAILSDIDRTLSGYNRSSELSRLNAGDTIVPSPMLIGLYNRSRLIWEQTGGAVDVAAGPLFDIWGFGFKSGEFPDDAAVSAALAVSGMGRMVPRMEDTLLPDGRLCASRLLAADFEARLRNQPKTSATPGFEGGSPTKTAQNVGDIPQLNFNAIAQGYSCDTVASYLSKLGVKDMLVDIGEILCRGVNASGKPWRIGVDRPADGNFAPGADLDGFWESTGTPVASSPQPGSAAIAEAPFQGIVTSGNYRKYYVRDGVKYSHTIDPRTGRPAENSLLSATVVAPSAEQADALATYCMVIGLEAARVFIESQPAIEGYLIFRTSDGSMSEWSSPGFNLK